MRTCPLVTKVHNEAKRFAGQGLPILLIGHDGHEEVEGTTGEAPDSIVLIQHPDDVDKLDLPADQPVACWTQTTLSVDETAQTVGKLRATGSRSWSIRHPTTSSLRHPEPAGRGRQIAAHPDLVIVVGSRNSNSAVRLVEVALEAGVRARLPGRRCV